MSRLMATSVGVATTLIVGLLAPSPVNSGEPGLQGRTDIYMQSSFESSDWDEKWSELLYRSNIEVVSGPEAFRGDRFLRVHVDEGDHRGTSLKYFFEDETGSEPTEVYFRYALRFGPNWIAYRNGKLVGPAGIYGKAGYGGNPSNGQNGWSARMTFAEPDSGRQQGNTKIGYYTYHADMDGTYGDAWYFSGPPIGSDMGLPSETWHQIEGYVRMNDPNGDASREGERNGVLRAWVDGTKVFEKTDLRFRDVSSIKIERIWANIYYGGSWTSPRDLHVDFDNVVIAENYIGPAKTSPPRERVGPRFSDDPFFGTRKNYAFQQPDRWRVVREDGDKRLFLQADSLQNDGEGVAARAIAKSRTYRGFDVSLTAKTAETLSRNESADYAVVFGWQHPDDYYYLLANGRADYSELFRVKNGQRTKLAEADHPLIPDENWHRLRVRYRPETDGRFLVSLDGKRRIETTLDRSPSGRVGVGSFNDSAYIDDIEVSREEGERAADTADGMDATGVDDAGPPADDTGAPASEDTGSDATAARRDGRSSADTGANEDVPSGSMGCGCRQPARGSGGGPAACLAVLVLLSMYRRNRTSSRG